MSTTIRELLVEFGVDADVGSVKEFDASVEAAIEALEHVIQEMAQFNEEAEESADAMEDVADEAEGAADSTAGLDDAMGGATITLGTAAKAAAVFVAGIAAITAATVALINSTREAGDEIDKNSDSLAMNAREYQVTMFAATQAGAELEQVRGGMTQLNAKVQAATKAGQGYVELLDGTTMSIRGANGEILTQTELLAKVADAVQAAATEEERLTIATSMLGMETGARLIPMLENGSEGIAAMEERAEALGIIMSDELVKSSADLTDRLGEVTGVLAGMRNAIAEKLLPVVNDLLGRFLDWYEANGDLIRQQLEEWADGIADGIERIGESLSKMDGQEGVFDDLVTVLDALVFGINLVLASINILSTAAAWGGLELAIDAIKIAWIALIVAAQLTMGWLILPIEAAVALFVGLVMVIDDLITMFEGGESAIGSFIERNREADTIVGALARGLENMIRIGMALYELVSALGALAVQVFGEAFGPYVETAVNLLGMLADGADMAVNAITPLLDALNTSLLGGALEGIGGLTAMVQGVTDGAEGAGSTSNAISNEISVTVSGDADGQSIAEQIREALDRSNRDAVAALAGAEV